MIGVDGCSEEPEENNLPHPVPLPLPRAREDFFAFSGHLDDLESAAAWGWFMKKTSIGGGIKARPHLYVQVHRYELAPI